MPEEAETFDEDEPLAEDDEDVEAPVLDAKPEEASA